MARTSGIRFNETQFLRGFEHDPMATDDFFRARLQTMIGRADFREVFHGKRD
jgi:hypothetical protein